MKILAVASEIYATSMPAKSITGLAIMVRDIFNIVSKTHDCYLLSSNHPLQCEEVSSQLHILDSKNNNWRSNIMPVDFIIGIFNFFLKRDPIKTTVRTCAKERISIKAFNHYISVIQPDIINLHEFTDLNVKLVKICKKRGLRFVITNHLYIGESKGCDAYEYLKKNETYLLNDPDIFLSVISTGMKKRIIDDYPALQSNHIFITIDGTRFADKEQKYEQMEMHVPDKKIFLCIGNVMQRKNQKQLIRAISKIHNSIKKDIIFYFLGTDRNGDIQRWINEFHCNDVAVYQGKVRSEDMPYYYEIAYATITTSFCEGFGLTMIEGYSYGVPSILPNDIDSFDDIYDGNCSISIEGREDGHIIEAINKCLSYKWNKEIIKQKSQEFSLENVGKSYIKMYNQILNI